MEKVNYANIANELLGDELYCKFIKEIAKENKGGNIVEYGKEVLNKCCFLILMIGMSKEVKLDTVKICAGKDIVEISCKEFANKYEKYIRKIESSIFDTVKSIKD